MAGDIFGIIGPNGAGKTTFFNMCTGMYTPTKGKVYLMGEDVTGFSSERVARKRMARTFQNLQLFKFMSVLDNVKIGCHIRTKSNMLDAIVHTRTYRQDEEYAISKSEEILALCYSLSEHRTSWRETCHMACSARLRLPGHWPLSHTILLLDEPAAGMNPLETQELMGIY